MLKIDNFIFDPNKNTQNSRFSDRLFRPDATGNNKINASVLLPVAVWKVLTSHGF